MAEAGAFLLMAVDPLLRRVDVDEGQDVRAGQQRRLAARAGPAAPGRPFPDPAGCSPRYRSAGASRAWTGRGPRRKETSMAPCRSRPMSSMLSAPAVMPATRQPTFGGGVHPALSARPDVLREQSREPGALREGHHREPGRRATRDSGRRTMPGSGPGYATISLARCPRTWCVGSVENSHHPSSEGTFRVAAPGTHLNHRWIEAKPRSDPPALTSVRERCAVWVASSQ